MKIHLINPNTTAEMTETMRKTAQKIAWQNTDIIAITPNSGPETIEGHFDEAISAVGVAKAVMEGEKMGADSYIIACFGDPGLLAARELTRAPVIGIAEAAFHMASLIATRFSIVTTLKRTGIIAEHLLTQYGFSHHCRAIRAAEIPVLDLEKDPDCALQKIIAECLIAKEKDNIGAIVLGCGGMADLTEVIEKAVGLPIVEGVTSAVKLAESLVHLRLKTSKFGDLDFPRPKLFTGQFSEFSGSYWSGGHYLRI